ncbi:MAG: phosphoenolpyruvate carboxylase [Chitinophagaceae bacterium]
MVHFSNRSLQQFRSEVGTRFQLYNSLFTSLPFHRIEKTGILLSLLSNICEEGYENGLAPLDIIGAFFGNHTTYVTEKEKNDLLFRFVQYIERQVVLFDALEDASFSEVNDLNGPGSLKDLATEVVRQNKEAELNAKLKDFSVRVVLTAHPTQFYPGPVLGIIHDLSKALVQNNTNLINIYLQQLGKTPFFKKKKPTPYDEAVSLVWYLENVFYAAAGKIVSELKYRFPDAVNKENPILRMGFWPGGDRDGNPFVNTGITLQVADALRSSIIKCYYLDVRKLRRRLTFEGVETLLHELEQKLYNNLFVPGGKTHISKEEILDTLLLVKERIIHQHNGLFLHMVENLVNKIELFGLYFATLDIRQDSTVHTNFYLSLAGKLPGLPAGYASISEDEQIRIMENLEPAVWPAGISDPLYEDTLRSVEAIGTIQRQNGPDGCNRYIISQCHSALHAMEVFGLFLLGGWKKEELSVDIVPLFETIDDLKRAGGIMKKLFSNPVYRAHLARRNDLQTIMVGFSDGTKDGGYLMANWSIYKAKEELTAIACEFGIRVIFFDGRGGPPSRGGGKTHRFYASMGQSISNQEIQLTIQGQTISSNFGIIDAAQFNMEQLLNAGISNDLFPRQDNTLTRDEEALIGELAEASLKAYAFLKDHPLLPDYLLQVSPLRYYSETNIGSRPAKRGNASGISLKDLRAIPYAGSWSQLKQNVTGYYGVGSAIRELEKRGKLGQLSKLYRESLYFRTLLDNCEMAMMKSFFPLTRFLSADKQFGQLWRMIHDEYELTRVCLFRVTGHDTLMTNYPVEQLSIQMRERIVLPLVTIQQYALTRIRELDEKPGDAEKKEVYEKLAMRCSFGIINAGRNSA